VTWTFAAGPHSVTDATRMGLFNSGRKRAGQSYVVAFPSAGSYPYRSAHPPNMTGRVDVPMQLTPASGTRNTNFRVYWAADFAPSGYHYQIQYRKPAAKVWEWFVQITVAPDAAMIPSQWGNKTGSYSFRARLLKSKGAPSGPSSNWSPISSISVR
jgi:hypothetical protein